MKKITTVLLFTVSLIFLACEGPEGPPGPPGFDGQDGADGVNILGNVLEIEGDFTPANEYSIFYEFPQTVEVFESDIVLVYLLWEVTEDDTDVWRLLPQTRILEQGLLQYNFDHTFLDVSIFLESDFDLGTLPAGDTDNQVFRIAILPAEFAQGAKLNLSDMQAVMGSLNVTEKDVKKVKL